MKKYAFLLSQRERGKVYFTHSTEHKRQIEYSPIWQTLSHAGNLNVNSTAKWILVKKRQLKKDTTVVNSTFLLLYQVPWPVLPWNYSPFIALHRIVYSNKLCIVFWDPAAVRCFLQLFLPLLTFILVNLVTSGHPQENVENIVASK